MTRKLIDTLKGLTKMEFNTTETLKQLTYGENVIRFWSWGVSQRINIENKGLLLKVNARRHKSYVFITLDFTDTYDVHIISNRGNILKSFDMVYFDMLTEIIDNEIERIPEYKD